MMMEYKLCYLSPIARDDCGRMGVFDMGASSGFTWGQARRVLYRVRDLGRW